jgi:uncharacterized protein YfaP (DUF2135 family)
MNSRVALALAAAAAPFLNGCGAASMLPSPSTSTHVPARSVVLQAGWELAAGQFNGYEATFTGGTVSATVDVTVQWTYAANDVDVFVTTTACTSDAFAAGGCSYVAKADGTATKPERLSFALTASGTYRVYVANFGPGQESGTLEIGITQ